MAIASSVTLMQGTPADLARGPTVAVVTTWNEAAPCNIELRHHASAAKVGIRQAGGVAIETSTIAVTDGIAMGTPGMRASLVSREIIADSVEAFCRRSGVDALLGIAGCDKTLPGLMMAMCRLDLPSVFMYGGTSVPGSHHGRPITGQAVIEGIGRVSAGTMAAEDLEKLEAIVKPSVGSCGIQATANTMACVSEALGLALPGSAGPPAVWADRHRFATASGRAAMAALGAKLRPRPSSAGARWRTPPLWSPPQAGRPTPRCTCRRLPTSAASSSICTTSV